MRILIVFFQLKQRKINFQALKIVEPYGYSSEIKI